jgi:ABC-2 type transport system ATP-binding protein
MADVQALCKRVVVIHHGRILFDGELADLAERFSSDKTVTARLADGSEVTVVAPRGDVAAATGQLLADHEVIDLTIEDPPIDDVIEQLFASEGAA